MRCCAAVLCEERAVLRNKLDLRLMIGPIWMKMKLAYSTKCNQSYLSNFIDEACLFMDNQA
jgi:hypothetical protein